MSIVKDFLLIAFFLFIIIKYFLLHKEMLKQRKYFINVLSHDLRVAAIAQIRGSELLQKESNSCCEILENLNESCRFSLDMINMLLNSFRYSNKEEFLNYEKFALSDSVNLVSKNLKKLAESKRISIIPDFSCDTHLMGEKEGINKVLLILISVALLNSFENKDVILKIINNSGKITFSVLYQGLSITKEEFNRMYSDNSNFSIVGQGIKLHLSKRIIDFHKGVIKVERLNNSYNSLSFTIPVEEKKVMSKLSLLSVFYPFCLTNL